MDEPPNELFREICVTFQVREFYSTPIHRFFTVRAIPGIHRYTELILFKKNVRTPMDLVKYLRLEHGHFNYNCQRWRTLYMVNYLRKHGLEGMNLYRAAVSIVCIELNAPKNGEISL